MLDILRVLRLMSFFFAFPKPNTRAKVQRLDQTVCVCYNMSCNCWHSWLISLPLATAVIKHCFQGEHHQLTTCGATGYVTKSPVQDKHIHVLEPRCQNIKLKGCISGTVLLYNLEETLYLRQHVSQNHQLLFFLMQAQVYIKIK